MFLVSAAAHAVWTDVWSWGIGIGLIICFSLAAWFSPVFKKDFVYAALIVGVLLAAYGYGTHVEAAICSAKEAAVTAKVDKIVAATKTPAARKKADPYNTKHN
jgi:hypothetical protein